MSVGPVGEGLPEDTECDFSVPSVGVCFWVDEPVASAVGVSIVKVCSGFFLPGLRTMDLRADDLGLVTLLDPWSFCDFFFFSFLIGEGIGETTFAP